MFRQLVRLIRRIIPWIIRFLRMLFFLTITAITSIWTGIPQAVRRISDQWVREFSAVGAPANVNNGVRIAGLIIASITLILGWLVLASLTVFIIRVVFF
jgi:hypothetical protein